MSAACNFEWPGDGNIKFVWILYFMDFWNSYKERAVGKFDQERIWLGTSERKIASLNAVSEFSIEVEVNRAFFRRYDEMHRYIIAREITQDLLFSAYNINSMENFVARITRQLSKPEWSKVFSYLRKFRDPNLEFRLIGLQNGGLTAALTGFDQIHRRVHGILAEVDLFGPNMRNVVIDTKTGATYDLLLNSKIYRAGELLNTVTKEDFASKLAQLSFV